MTPTLLGTSVAPTSTLGLGEVRPARSGDAFYAPPRRQAPRRHIHYADNFSPRSTQLILGDRNLAVLNRLLALPERWDGFRARPVTETAAKGAMTALFEVAHDGSLSPQVVPLVDGGVQLEWHAGGYSLEIEIDALGTRHYFAVNDRGDIVLNADPAESEVENLPGLVERLLADLTDLVRRAKTARGFSESRIVPIDVLARKRR